MPTSQKPVIVACAHSDLDGGKARKRWIGMKRSPNRLAHPIRHGTAGDSCKVGVARCVRLCRVKAGFQFLVARHAPLLLKEPSIAPTILRQVCLANHERTT